MHFTVMYIHCVTDEYFLLYNVFRLTACIYIKVSVTESHVVPIVRNVKDLS